MYLLCRELRVCSPCTTNFSLKSNIKTAKVSPTVCCRGSSEHMDVKSMPTRDTFSISMYILGMTPIHLHDHDSTCYSRTFVQFFSHSTCCTFKLWRNNLHIRNVCVCKCLLGTSVNILFCFVFYQLVLEAHNVPELSAGVNCTFEDLAEMNGLVEGNQIRCSSPAEKEMPRIIVDKGEGGAPAALFHKTNKLHATYVHVQPPDILNKWGFFLFWSADSVKIFCCHQPLSGPW